MLTPAEMERLMNEAGERKGADPALLEFLKGDIACPKCRYNLRGVTAESCPECGWELRLELRSYDSARKIRWALLIACAWAVAVNVASTFPFVNRLIRGPEGKPNVWWWLTTGWPSAVCAAGFGMFIGLALMRDRQFTRKAQRWWLLGLLLLLLPQLAVTAVLAYRWFWENARR